MAGEPLFLLGVGAQKAGTTWLQRYVIGDPSVATPAMKEFHVWNEVYSIDDGEPVALEGFDTAERENLRRRMIARPAHYFDYFSNLMRESQKAITCDITPAYAGLPLEAFVAIRNGFADRGIQVRAIFLLRDPIERCWSAVRMYRRKRKFLPDVGIIPDSDDEAVIAYGTTCHAQRRGRYEKTIAALEQSFGAENIHIAVYETMFAPDRLAALSSFARLQLRPEEVAHYYNQGSPEGELKKKTRGRIAREYRPTLEYCAHRFPETLKCWESYSDLG